MAPSPAVSVRPIATSILAKGEDLDAFFARHLAGVALEGRVLAITSKIVSLAEGQVIARDSIDKGSLVRREADHYLGPGGYGIELTVKHGLLIPSAGIDESNSADGGYILFPARPFESAERIWRSLRARFGLRQLGVIITDSHTTPLRRGVTGISLAHFGFHPTRSLVGRPDLFGRELKFTSVDVVDALAGMAVFVMGESDDRCPLAIVEGAQIEFTERDTADEVRIALENDLYYPMLEPVLKNQRS